MIMTAGGCTRIVVMDEAVLGGVVTGDDAVIVTTLPVGTLDGAV